MADAVTVRPLLPADVAAADAVAYRALAPDGEHDEVRQARGRARIAHLLGTDPGGCWVAERGGEVLGVAIALVREGLWGFSLFAVREEDRGERIGARLYDAALAYGDGCRGGLICSSEHPAAMRRYATSGFRLLPAVSLAGVLDRRGLPSGLRSRPGDLLDEADAATCAQASRFARGAAHGPDLGACQAAGGELLVLPGRGFAFHREGSPFLLAALDEEAATDLVQSCFAAALPGATVQLDFVTAGNDWAIAAGLACRLALSADGPVFVRGDVGAFAPYVPSGAYL